MPNFKIITLFTALLGGLLIIFAAPQNASAQFIPPGSYQKSCKAISATGVVLSATCKPKSESSLSEFFGGKKFYQATEPLGDYYECEGDISNDDGQLKCNRNTNSALMQKAKSALDAGYKNVVGVELSSYPNQQKYLRLAFQDGYAQKFYDGTLGGFVNLGLLDFFQTWLSKPENANVKSGVIKRAFYEVYNYGPSPKDVAAYTLTPKTGYQTIILAEQKKLNSDKVIRRLMIAEAYKWSMGRNPTAAEFDYWLPKQEYFTQLVEANRSFLYGGSPKGNSDLVETIKRAMNKSGNNPNPDINQINKAITKYSAMNPKPVYDGMN